MRKVKISVIVITFNSRWDKTKRTLDSVIAQKDVDYEIIISDDGSKINNYKKIESYFKERKFDSFVLVNNDKNVGTIKNILRALEVAKGKYVKAISPGDILLSPSTLKEWVIELEKSGRRWSFGEVMYSWDTRNNPIEVFTRAHMPQDVKSYINEDDKRCIYNCVVKNDRPNPIGIIFERHLWKEYLMKLSEWIVYAEDFAYSIMMLDNILPFYFPHNVGIHEWGEGVSTSGNKEWMQILLNERDTVYRKFEQDKKFRELKKNGSYENIHCENAISHKRMSGLTLSELELTGERYEECCARYFDIISMKSREKKIWIYGAGFGGKILHNFLLKKGIFVEGFIDINYQKIGEVSGTKVIGINDVDSKESFIAVTLLDYCQECVECIENNGFTADDYCYIRPTNTIEVLF